MRGEEGLLLPTDGLEVWNTAISFLLAICLFLGQENNDQDFGIKLK